MKLRERNKKLRRKTNKRKKGKENNISFLPNSLIFETRLSELIGISNF